MLVMSEKEFMDLALEKCELYRVETDRYNRYEECPKAFKDKLTLSSAYLYCGWVSSHVRGGSCWDTGEKGDPHYTEPGEPEPEFEALDNFLLQVCPNMSFLHYKKLLQSLKRGDFGVSEYYGNSTEYAFKVISLRDLYDALVELKLIEEKV